MLYATLVSMGSGSERLSRQQHLLENHQSLIHPLGHRHELREQLTMVSRGRVGQASLCPGRGAHKEKRCQGKVLGRPTENMAGVIFEQAPIRLDLNNKE